MANEFLDVAEEATAEVAPVEETAAPVQDLPSQEVSVDEAIPVAEKSNDVPSKEVSQETFAEPVAAPEPVEEVRDENLVYLLWKGWTETLDLEDGTVIGKKKPVGVSKEVADNLLNTYYYAKDLEVA